MSAVQNSTGIFPATVVETIFNKTKGHSTLAKLSGREPVDMTGSEVVTFTFDGEVNIVGESQPKTNGGITVAPVMMQPIKVEYGARVSDEFMYCAEEKQIEFLTAFNDGYSRKLARALDIMAMHGVNPRTGTASNLIGTNSFDTNTGVAVITYDASAVYDNLDAAVTALGDNDVTGYALGKDFSSKLSKVTVGNDRPFAAFQLGGNPGALNGVAADVNSTVGVGDKDKAIVGDFENAFKWGIAKDIRFEVIPYGNPDNSEIGDLKGHNQVFLRAETYIAWGILDAAAFSRVAVVESH